MLVIFCQNARHSFNKMRMSKRGLERRHRAQERDKNASRNEKRENKNASADVSFLQKLFLMRITRLILLAAAVGVAAIAVDKHFSHDNIVPKNLTPVSAQKIPVSAPQTPIPAPEKQKYTYQIDGITIESTTVSEVNFRKAYDYAKGIVGGIYWQPKNLSVEYGDVAAASIDHLADEKHFEVVVSSVNKDFTKIIANPEALPHELTHFLLGPEARKWPLILREFIATAADGNKEEYSPEDLDQPWISMPSAKSLHSVSPMLGARYEALSQVSKKNHDKIPAIIKAAIGKTNLTFQNIHEFLGKFGIQHNVLKQGESGAQFGFCKYKGPRGKGYLFFRYKRVKDDEMEYPWKGTIKAVFKDEKGDIYEGLPTEMEGTSLIDPPPTTNKLAGVQVQCPDGVLEHSF